MRLLALLLLLPATAFGALPNRAHTLKRNAGGASAVALSIPADVVGTTVDGVTCTRSTTGTYLTTASTIASAAINACRVEPDGLLVEPTRTNVVLRSEEFSNATWVKQGTSSVAANTTVAPDGTTTADTLTVAASPNGVYQDVTGLGANVALAASFWLKKSSGTILYAVNPSTGSRGQWQVALASVGTGWERITRNHPAVTVDFEFAATAGGNSGFFFYGDAAVVAIVWGAQLEVAPVGSVTSYIPTAGSTVQRTADAATATNPLTSEPSWCLAAKVKPSASRSWSAAAANLLGLGGAVASANSSIGWATAGGTIGWSVYDSGAAVRTHTTAAHGYAAGSQHSLTFCSDNGTLSVYGDGADLGGSVAGAGTGIITTQPASLLLGPNGGGVNETGGNLQSIKVCRSGNPARCQP